MTTRAIITTAAVIAFLMGSVRPANAAPIAVTYSGHVTALSFTGPSPFSIGDTWTFSYLLDLTAPDSDASSNVGLYGSSALNATGQVGAYSFAGAGYHVVTDSMGAPDSLWVVVVSELSLGATIVGDPAGLPSLPLAFFYVRLGDPTGTALSSAALTVPPLASFNSPELIMGFSAPGGGLHYTVHGTITGLRAEAPTTVPEPGAMMLLGAGLMGLVLRCVGRRA